MIEYIRVGDNGELHKVSFYDSIFYYTNRVRDGEQGRFLKEKVREVVQVGVVPGDEEILRPKGAPLESANPGVAQEKRA